MAIDRYVVEGLLGAGGMAEVYAVRHALLGSSAALKVLKTRSPQLTGRMMREGRAQARLRHPNVVAVLDLLDVDGAPALLMERVEGPTLAELLGAGPLPLERVDHLARGILLGLDAAHQLGIVHRDLKPANVLIAGGDLPRIADFGLATALADDTDPALTRPGSPIGTPAYMAPEQHEDASVVDARADLFAFGVLLYEMLCGVAPAAGANLVVAWSKMTQRRWKPVLEVRPETPPRLCDAVQWALEPDRDKRVPSVRELWAVLFEEPFPVPTEVVTAPLPVAAEPPARPPASANSAIPKPARSLVGRASELEAALQRLEPRGGLVTLVGTAGVGKTRIAIELAARWRHMRRPALWIELQGARDAEDLVRAVASSLPIAERVTADTVGRTLSRHGPLLVVLDNLEQLPPDALELVGAWVRAAPSLRVLGTSRQPLGLVEEQIQDVPPLTLPRTDGDVAGSEAWRLLVAAAPAGVLDEVSPSQARRLLTALDGLPLALELAAARLEVLTVAQLEERMRDRFALLSAPPGTTDPQRHHGALFDAIAWSWSLLGEAERAALGQLSVFAAPCGLDAAEAVVGLQDDDEVQVLDALHSLVRRSLVRRTGARFSLLGAIREFADRQLDDAQRRRAWARHAAWFARRVEDFTVERRVVFTSKVDPEEYMADWGAVLDRAQQEPALVDAALSCALGRSAAYEIVGPFEGSLRVCDAALALPDPGTPQARFDRCALRLRRAFALRRTGRAAEALEDLNALVEEDLEPSLRGTVLGNLGDLYHETGDLERARATYGESLELARRHGPRHMLPTAAASVASLLDDPDACDALLQEALDAAEDPAVRMQIHKDRGWVAVQRYELAQAEREYREVLTLADRLGHRRARLYAVGQLGFVHEIEGRLEEALAEAHQAEIGMDEDGDLVFGAWYRTFRARILARLGRWEEARPLVEQVLTVPGLNPSHALLTRRLRAVIAARLRDLDAAAALEQTEACDALPRRIAEAYLAADRGELGLAREVIAACRAEVRGLRHDLLLDCVAQELEEECTAWRISADGATVLGPDGAHIDLGKHVANARILAHLAAVRTEAPGRTTDAEGLATAGWPGERIVPSAAANRVRVALSALRRAGLAALIDRGDGGWRLDPEQPLRYPYGVTSK
ncbi:MAG: protein kinase [Myxococcota bacterium]